MLLVSKYLGYQLIQAPIVTWASGLKEITRLFVDKDIVNNPQFYFG